MPDVGVAGEGPGIGVLPDLVGPPATRQRRGGRAAVRGEEQRGVHRGPVPHHVIPPVQAGVEHGPAAGGVVVRVREAHDPVAHLLRAEAVVPRKTGVRLEVEHAGQGDAIAGPASTIVEEELGLLLGSAGIGPREVVAASRQTRVAGAEVLVVEVRAAEGAALGGLDVGEAGAELSLGGPVDLSLPAGDVLAVDAAGGLSDGCSERGRSRGERCRAEHAAAQDRASGGGGGGGGTRSGDCEVSGKVGRHECLLRRGKHSATGATPDTP